MKSWGMHNAENNDENPQWIIYVLLNVHNTQCALYQLPYLVETQFFVIYDGKKKKYWTQCCQAPFLPF